MEKLLDQMSILIGGYLPKMIGAILLLVGGWMLARLIASFILATLARFQFNSRVGNWIALEADETPPELDRRLASISFVFIMFFVLIGFFQVLSLTLITEPLNSFLVQVFEFAPRILSAIIIGLVAWIIAGLLRIFIIKLTDTTQLDNKLGDALSSNEASRGVPLAKTLSDAAFWLVLLLFLPALLSALNLDGLLGPVQSMINKLLGFMPNFFAAAVILLSGWFLAKIVERLVANIGTVSGINQLVAKTGLTQLLGSRQPADLLAQAVYILILIPVLIAGLNVLELDALTRPASEMLQDFLSAIPLLFAALVLLLIAYCIGRVLAQGLTELGEGMGIDRLPQVLGFSKSRKKPKLPLSSLLGQVLLVGIMLFAAMEACSLVHFSLMAELLQQFINFFAQVFIGLVIFAVALYLARLAGDTILASGGSQAAVLAGAARISIYLLGGAMTLQQMGFAADIIRLAFGILFGAFAVALAIAFGWGGKDVANQLVQKFYANMQNN